MSDDEFDADEALQEIDSLLEEISVEASSEDEHTLQTDSQTTRRMIHRLIRLPNAF